MFRFVQSVFTTLRLGVFLYGIRYVGVGLDFFSFLTRLSSQGLDLVLLTLALFCSRRLLRYCLRLPVARFILDHRRLPLAFGVC